MLTRYEISLHIILYLLKFYRYEVNLSVFAQIYYTRMHYLLLLRELTVCAYGFLHRVKKWLIFAFFAKLSYYLAKKYAKLQPVVTLFAYVSAA